MKIGYAVCAIGVTIALSMSNIIELLSLGCSFCIAGCLVPLVGGAWWKKGTAKGAAASAIVGIAILLLDYTGLVPVPYECVLSLVPATIVYVTVGLMTRPRSRQEETN